MNPSWRPTLPPISTSAIDAFESERGLRIPAPYRAHLAIHNGGMPAPNGFRLRVDDEHELESRVHFLYGIGLGPTGLDLALTSHVDLVSAGLFPIGRTTTGDLLLVDATESSSSGQVLCRVHDDDEEHGDTLRVVAPSLSEFLSTLDDALLVGPVGELGVPDVGLTWHLDGGGEHVLLVPSDLHDAVPHGTPRLLGLLPRTHAKPVPLT